MGTPDPALGIAVNFPEERVRKALHFAMQMGSPNDQTRQVRFIRRGSTLSYQDADGYPVDNPRVDRDGRPLSPDIRLVQNNDQDLNVDCAIEITPADADELPVGDFRPVKAEVTLHDTEYAEVAGCNEILYNGDRYRFGYEPEIPSLFGIDFHVLIFYALDET